MRLSELIDNFIGDVCAGKTNETPTAYRSKLNHLLRYLGNVETISQEDIDRYRRWMLTHKTHMRGGREVKGPLSLFTVRTVFQTTRHFIGWGHDHGYMDLLTLRQVTEPEIDPKAVDHITAEKLIDLASQEEHEWERSRNLAILYTLIDTGGRVGAISKIDVSNLNLVDGYATTIDKGDQFRWLYFTPPTISAIQEWLCFRDGLHPKDYLLWTGAKKYGLSRQGIYRMLSSLADAGGITARHNPHSFRHAFARDAIVAGADLSQVSEILGHKSTVVTAKYYARWQHAEVQKFHDKYSPARQLPVL